MEDGSWSKSRAPRSDLSLDFERATGRLKRHMTTHMTRAATMVNEKVKKHGPAELMELHRARAKACANRMLGEALGVRDSLVDVPDLPSKKALAARERASMSVTVSNETSVAVEAVAKGAVALAMPGATAADELIVDVVTEGITRTDKSNSRSEVGAAVRSRIECVRIALAVVLPPARDAISVPCGERKLTIDVDLRRTRRE